MKKLHLSIMLAASISQATFAQSTITKAEVTYEKNWRTLEHKIILTQEFKTRIKTKSMQFEFSNWGTNGNKLPEQPEIASYNISLKEGVFGVKAGMKTIDAFKILGVPTSEVALNDSDVLYSFGRNLWLVAKNDKVHIVTNKNNWISSTLKSLIAFDERNLNSWKIDGHIEKRATKQQVLESLDGEFIDDAKFRLNADSNDIGLEIEFVKDSFSKGAMLIVNEFRYGNLTDNVSMDANYINDNTQGRYDTIDDMIRENTKNKDATLISDLPYYPIFTAYGADKQKIYAYDNHLILIADDEEIKKIYIAETLFHNTNSHATWKLGNIYAHQASDEIADKFEGEVFGVDDYWEVYTDAFKYDFYFKKDNETLVLDELAIEIY
ncbi:hypothetical protein KUL156_37890 [Alteromonas sp. KUL156]|nr:hypothetical protein KUL154_22740 [Alteromonas sp. KUL154]GFE01197.1 hypothetical protein KUL156_37890 [Alteromonas sp. KUL156]